MCPVSLDDFNGEELLWLAIHSNASMRGRIQSLLDQRAAAARTACLAEPRCPRYPATDRTAPAATLRPVGRPSARVFPASA